ncbi:MAG: redox-regulated ATPase YchF [Deltaproteobacteria bacterium]|nr:redox-regulated ATPase YchF [Deltaproteobacteria bacterium]
MHVGICGFAGSGKTTVFTALAPGGKAEREVSFGNIKVPDDRVDFLASVFKPKKVRYAEITFVDVAGSSGGKAGGAFTPAVLQGMKNADVLVHVVRGFENPSLTSPPDPERDERLFNDELLLHDLGTVEKRVDRMKREQKKGAELDAMTRCLSHLEGGAPLRTLDLSDEDVAALGPGIQLLSMTPLITLYNLSEAAWADPASAKLRETRREKNASWLAICGAIEAEIAALPIEEQKDFLDGLGLGEPARNVFVREAYALLDYISFLTAGADECRAWPIRRGASARKAAGKIHSDIERGFIRAEIYRPDELKAFGSEAALKTAGKIRAEGKDYVMQDGDVVNFRFNV